MKIGDLMAGSGTVNRRLPGKGVAFKETRRGSGGIDGERIRTVGSGI